MPFFLRVLGRLQLSLLMRGPVVSVLVRRVLVRVLVCHVPVPVREAEWAKKEEENLKI